MAKSKYATFFLPLTTLDKIKKIYLKRMEGDGVTSKSKLLVEAIELLWEQHKQGK